MSPKTNGCFLLVGLLVMAAVAAAADPKWRPPRVIYIEEPLCEAYLQASREPGCEFNYFRYWAYGYVSGLNDSLPNGGNVLGRMDANADDFMARIRAYCVKHPDHGFFKAISKTLHTITPVDWQGNPQRSK